MQQSNRYAVPHFRDCRVHRIINCNVFFHTWDALDFTAHYCHSSLNATRLRSWLDSIQLNVSQYTGCSCNVNMFSVLWGLSETNQFNKSDFIQSALFPVCCSLLGTGHLLPSSTSVPLIHECWIVSQLLYSHVLTDNLIVWNPLISSSLNNCCFGLLLNIP